MRIEKDQVITLGVMAALGVAFGLFAWMPARAESRSYTQRIEAARAHLGPQTQGDALAERDRSVRDLQAEINEQDRYVPAGPELASVLRSLTRAVRDRGIQEHELETLETAEFARYSVIPARLAFQSDFGQAFNVLTDIEAMPRLIRVDQLELRAQRDGDTSNPTLDATMRLSTFHSTDPESE